MKPFTTTKLGKLYCNDCYNILPDIPSNSIDLILIDPPYGNLVSVKWDTDVMTDKLIVHLHRVLKDSGSLYCWCGIGEKNQSLIKWFPMLQKHFRFKDLITWKKCRGIGMRKGWLYTREECMWFVKDNKKFIWNEEHQYSNEKRKLDGFIQNGQKLSARTKSTYKRLTNVWTDIPEITIRQSKEWDGIHIASKPIALFRRIILAHTQEYDTVLDCFMGSGTTALACQELNRKWIGVEIDKEYCQLIQSRLCKYNNLF